MASGKPRQTSTKTPEKAMTASGAPVKVAPHSGAPEEGEAGSTDRLLFLSDGVIAIAITLLVLEIKVPHLEEAAPTASALWQALAEQWPVYFAYVITFLNIGVMWANHVTLFRYIKRSDHTLTVLNTLLLFCISLNPFITSLMAEYLMKSPAHRQVAVIVFVGFWLITAVFFQLLWFYASSRGGRLIDRRFSPAHYREISTRYLFGFSCYFVALALALLGQSWVSLAVMTFLTILWGLPYTVSQAIHEAETVEDEARRFLFKRGMPRR